MSTRRNPESPSDEDKLEALALVADAVIETELEEIEVSYILVLKCVINLTPVS